MIFLVVISCSSQGLNLRPWLKNSSVKSFVPTIFDFFVVDKFDSIILIV